MTRYTTTSLWGIAFFIFFTAYFSFLSEKLPSGSGPDEFAHSKAAQFIYEYGRLPVYPEDEARLHYAPYGTTRSFRPPLTYIVSASLYRFSDALGVKFTFPYRKANALFGGLSALFLFLAVYIGLGRLHLATSTTVLYMLMPQVSFIFSYLNSDGSALMAVNLILLAVALLLKKGINTKTLAFFGISCGILSICKVSAWVFSLPLCVFSTVLIWKSNQAFLKSLAIIGATFMLSGGWRIIFNIYHHGILNPFNWKLDAGIIVEHARIKASEVVNFDVLGYGYIDLLSNIDSFLEKTFYSFVANLDWLRLTVGMLQYTLYGYVLWAVLIACMAHILRPVYSSNKNKTEYYFGLAIIAGTAMQIYLYLQFNIYHDIQTQGKYILPAFAGLLVLLAIYINKLYTKLLEPWAGPTINTLVVGTFMAAVLYIHAHAMYKYVIPFYYSNAFVDTSPERYTNIDIHNQATRQSNDMVLLDESPEQLDYEITGYDPWLSIKSIPIDATPKLILVKIHLISNQANFYYFYWDAGSGMSEHTLVKGFSPAGENTIYQILPVSKINSLRFDFGEPGTKISIFNLAYSELKYKPLVGLLNKLFNVEPSQSSLPIHKRLKFLKLGSSDTPAIDNTIRAY